MHEKMQKVTTHYISSIIMFTFSRYNIKEKGLEYLELSETDRDTGLTLLNKI